MAIEDKLLKMKKQVEEARTRHDQAQGALNQLHEQLKREFKVDSVQEAEKLLTKLEIEKEQLDEDIEDIIKKLEADYDWE